MIERKELEWCLDTMQRRVLRARENMRCFICGVQADHVAHIYGRRYLHTRWDTHEQGNCHMLCAACHEQSHRVNTDRYKAAYLRRHGCDALLKVRERSREVECLLKVELLDWLDNMLDEYAEVLQLKRGSDRFLQALPERVVKIIW